MKQLKFSFDYEKLPVNWENTNAVLIGVCTTTLETMKNVIPNFLKYDTKLRNEEKYYELKAKDYLILFFIHVDSGVPFTAVRRNYEQKYEYYADSVGELFTLVKIVI